MKRFFAFILILCFLYLLAWNVIIRFNLLPEIPFFIEKVPKEGTKEKIAITERVEIIIMRYGFLPVYWTRIGNLMPFHHAFIIIVLIVIAFIIKRRKIEVTIR